VGVLHGDRDPALTYCFGAAALAATAAVLVLPVVLSRETTEQPPRDHPGRLRQASRFVRDSLANGVRDAVDLLRRRSLGVLLGATGITVFDLAVLAAAFKAVGYVPPLGILVLGYLIGQLGGNL